MKKNFPKIISIIIAMAIVFTCLAACGNTECKVIFDLNPAIVGQTDESAITNTPSVKTVSSGKTVSKPEDPAWSGYSFDGWYTDSDCTEEYKFEAQSRSRPCAFMQNGLLLLHISKLHLSLIIKGLLIQQLILLQEKQLLSLPIRSAANIFLAVGS